jgi:hypothetical protein
VYLSRRLQRAQSFWWSTDCLVLVPSFRPSHAPWFTPAGLSISQFGYDLKEPCSFTDCGLVNLVWALAQGSQRPLSRQLTARERRTPYAWARIVTKCRRSSLMGSGVPPMSLMFAPLSHPPPTTPCTALHRNSPTTLGLSGVTGTSRGAGSVIISVPACVAACVCALCCCFGASSHVGSRPKAFEVGLRRYL